MQSCPPEFVRAYDLLSENCVFMQFLPIYQGPINNSCPDFHLSEWPQAVLQRPKNIGLTAEQTEEAWKAVKDEAEASATLVRQLPI